MTLTDKQTLKIHLSSLGGRRDFLFRKAQEGRALAELAALIYVIELIEADYLSDIQKDNDSNAITNTHD